MENIIQLKHISKDYQFGESVVHALKDVNLVIKKGELVALQAPSGAGKSTLLHILGLLDSPSQGEYLLEGKIIDAKTRQNVLARLRLKKIGFIFQTFNLIPRMSALANVELPMIYAKEKQRRQRAIKLLTEVGLKERIYHSSDKLSGGERQRVAVARALANNPQIILADEPTGNLDSKNGEQIIKILLDLHAQGKTIVIVTHDDAIARVAERIIYLKDGRVVTSPTHPLNRQSIRRRRKSKDKR